MEQFSNHHSEEKEMFPRDALISISATVLILNTNHFQTNKIVGKKNIRKYLEQRIQQGQKVGFMLIGAWQNKSFKMCVWFC